MNQTLILAINSITLGGLLFLLSAGFSLIFGLMRIPNLIHGSLFMLGAYVGATFAGATVVWHYKLNFWVAAAIAALIVGAFGGLVERFLLRRLAGQQLAQVLVTLGIAFMIADFCLMVWTGDPISVPTPPALVGVVREAGLIFPIYRLVIILIACVFAAALWLLLDRTRLGAMIRASVDDPQMARVVGIPVSRLFTVVYCLGAALAAFAGMIGAPILSVYPGLDFDMLPLALVVVILGGAGSLLGSFVGSFIIALSLQLRTGDVSGACLFRAVPADGDCAAAASARPVRTGHDMNARRLCLAVAAVILVTLPYWVPGTYYTNIASQILFYAIFALAVDILLGYGGLVSLGHAGLFGIACYTVAAVLAAGHGHVVAIVLAIATTLIATAIFALVALRAAGIGFLMITLALGQIIWGLAYRWISVTNGDNGLSVAGRPAPFGISLSSAQAFYYATLVLFVMVLPRPPFSSARHSARRWPAPAISRGG